MLSPEVSKYREPQVNLIINKNADFDQVCDRISLNNFYKSIVVTCPDETRTPSIIEDMLTDDSEYYKLHDCPIAEFAEVLFIENFVKHGSFYCLSVDRNSITENCASVTPDGILTLHLMDFVYQSLGFEGTMRRHNYFQVDIDLKNLKNRLDVKSRLEKLHSFDFYITWEPDEPNVCPSSIAKYFTSRRIAITTHKVEVKKITPEITEIPSVKDVNIEEMAEWIGLLALEADLSETEPYISTYTPPESAYAIQSNNMCMLHVSGFLSPITINIVCENMVDYVRSRKIDNYWAAISVQSIEESLWQWKPSTPRMFQAHDSSCTVFFTRDQLMYHLVGQIKYV